MAARPVLTCHLLDDVIIVGAISIAERRSLRVVKLRGVRFRGGHHDYTIETGGRVEQQPGSH